MLNVLIKKRLHILTLIVMIFIGALSFQSNFFKFADQYFFDTFDIGSQSLVLGGITADNLGLEKQGAHIGFLSIGEKFDYTKNMLDAYPIFEGEVSEKDVFFSPYKSQFGVQGPIFSTVYSLFDLNTIYKLQLVSSIALALVVGLLTLLYFNIYNARFAVVFFFVMISSPWVIAFARNLYWLPVLWFLPAVFAALAYRSRIQSHKFIYIGLVGVAVIIKSLAGYEYLSAITLFTCSVFVVAPFFKVGERQYRQNFLFFVLCFSACVFGFVCALLLHAGMRGDSIFAGLQNIFEQDVKRRTYGDPSTFDDVFKASLQSSPFDVLLIYINNWNTSLAAYLPGGFFKGMIVFVVCGGVYALIAKKVLSWKNSVLFVFFFIASSSWFVLAKGHSYIHTQLNYVLWYFGFVQALFYICLSCLIFFFKDCYMCIRGRSFYRACVMMSVLLVGMIVLMLLGSNDEREKAFEGRLLKITSENRQAVISFGALNVKVTSIGELALYSSRCEQVDLSTTFFLHVYKTGVPIGEINYENLDFKWERFEFPAPKWPSKYAASCIAIVKLPSYSIDKLEFGQYSVANGVINIIWRNSVSFEAREQVTKITPVDLSDKNWNNGISVNRFFVVNDFVGRQSLQVNGVLKFASSGVRKISALEYTESYINVTVDGAPLNSKLDGYPNAVEIQP